MTWSMSAMAEENADKALLSRQMDIYKDVQYMHIYFSVHLCVFECPHKHTQSLFIQRSVNVVTTCKQLTDWQFHL